MTVAAWNIHNELLRNGYYVMGVEFSNIPKYCQILFVGNDIITGVSMAFTLYAPKSIGADAIA